MLESLSLLTVTAQMEAGWFARNWSDLMVAIGEGQVWQILTNPYGIAVGAILLILAFMTKSKGPLMAVIAAYGYSAAYHYTIATKKAGDVHFDMNTMKAVEIGPLVTFFLAVLIVSAVLLYLGLIKK